MEEKKIFSKIIGYNGITAIPSYFYPEAELKQSAP
jgi:hypothetical protein